MFSDKKTRLIFLVCCVLSTLAFIFQAIDSHIQRGEIRRAISGLDIDWELREIRDEISDIASRIGY
jgi:hypothetical protein